MIFTAVLSNKAHPETGQVTIPFPIPDNEYDHTIDLLESMGIGSPTAQDCRVDELDGAYPVFSCLTGQDVNVDELDYLAKQMELLSEIEEAQFMAVASKLGLSDIRDFINLVFRYDRATVITDFSELEQVGSIHRTNLILNSLPTGKNNNSDSRAIALDLIQSGTGVVTPYGVVYDNGMELEPLYDGLRFPPCYYDCVIMELSTPEESAMNFFLLPMSDCRLRRTQLRGGIQNPDTPLIVGTDYLPDETSRALALDRLTVGDLPALNRLCHAILPLDEAELKKLDAMVVQTGASDIDSICQLAVNLDQFDITPKPERDSQSRDNQVKQGPQMEGLM